MSSTLFLLVLPALAALVEGQPGTEAYVVANVNDSCPVDECHLLDEIIDYYTNFSITFPFTTVNFLSGVHKISSAEFLNMESIVWTGAVNISVCDAQAAPIIQCESLSEVLNIGFSRIIITCLQFYSCHIHTFNSRGSFSPFDITIIDVNFYESFFESDADRRMAIASTLLYNTGVSIQDSRPPNPTFITIIISGCRFLQNQPPMELPGVTDNRSMSNADNGIRSLLLYETIVNIINCDFRNSQNSAISAQLSIVFFSGPNTTFINNTGAKGGAIRLEGSSIRLSPPTNLTFVENHATDVGGAIFSTEELIGQHLTSLLSPLPNTGISNPCTIQSLQGNDFHFRFVNNTALNGGSAIHGVTLNSRVCDRTLIGVDRIDETNFSFEPDDISTVTSNPQRICICSDGIPDCDALESGNNTLSPVSFEIFPGQQISVNIIAVGFTFGTVSSPVYARLLSPGPNTQLSSSFEEAQILSHTRCNQISFTVLSDRLNETLILSPFIESPATEIISSPGNRGIEFSSNESNAFLRLTETADTTNFIVLPLQIFIKYLECPLGFELTVERPQCECEPILQEHSLECDLNTQTVTRRGNTWISASPSTDNKTIVHEECPFGFCDEAMIAVDLLDPDTQCSFNRSGTLCGGCKPGLSIVLGSSECRECSNDYITLLIVFIAAGIALVLFLKLLNLTVSQGTIGGLIFYANIVGANQSIFFPQNTNTFTKILNAFIAWINLDWGINTCFFDGLDAYVKTWLQFVFPLYIWSIAIIMIVTAHYSTYATKLFGSNSVPVLATLLLLSYAKLLRTIIIIFAASVLELPDGSEEIVWSFDGNLEYLGSKHAILFVTALLMVILLWLPYTTILVLGHLPKKLNKYRGFGWMVYVNNFFDAYYAPFNNKHVHWVGILLLVRIFLFAFFAAFFAIQNNVNLLLIAFTGAILLLYTPALGHAYREKKHTLLEASFLLNLIILSGGTFYVRLTDGNQEALISISIVIAFLEFAGIVVYHTYHFVIIQRYEKHKRITTIKKRSKSIPNETVNVNEDDELPYRAMRAPSTTYIAIDGDELVSCTVIAKPNQDLPLTQQVNKSDIPTDQRNQNIKSFELSEAVETSHVSISVPGYVSKSE